MIQVVVGWMLAVFAAGSGVAKIYGIEAERTGADELGIPYLAMRCMGVAHIVSAGLLATGRPLAGALVLGASYLPFVYIAFAAGRVGLAWICVGVVCVTIVFAWRSASATDQIAEASQIDRGA